MTANPLVKGILDEIAIKIYQGSEYDGKKSAVKNGKPLVLLCGSDFEKDRVLGAIDLAAQKYGPLTVALTRNAERFYPADSLKKRVSISRVYLESDHGDMERWLGTVKQVWCPNITQTTLVKLSRGIADSMGTCLLWWALSAEKPVTLTLNAANHWTGSLSVNHPMRMLLDEASRQVEAFGAQMVTEYSWEPSGVTCETVSNPLAVRLIHESNLVEQAGPQKKLTLTKGQLITPAAKDLAKARGIEIQWK